MHSYHKEIIDLVKCPKCGDVFLKEFYETYEFRSCRNKIDHKITIKFCEDKLRLISINLDSMTKVIWNFRLRLIQIQGLNISKIEVKSNVPFFEPKLLEYDKLLNKIRTYILFS